MWCLIWQPNSASAKLEIKLDSKAIGQQCLEKVCEYLGIGPEADYFGLRLPAGPHHAHHTAALQNHETSAAAVECDCDDGPWANLRHQLPGTHRRVLRLRVKFWVPPHRLLLEATRRQFYQQARHDLVDGNLVVADWRVACRLVALIAQAEFGDYDDNFPPQCLYQQCQNIGPQEEKPIDYVQRIIDHHCQLSGMRASTAEYHLLKEISNLESFGEELFFCRPSSPSNDNNAHSLYTHLLYHNQDEEEEEGRGKYNSMYASQTVGCLTTGSHHHDEGRVIGCGCRLGMSIGVGPQGIMVYRPGNGTGGQRNEKQRIPYTAIIRAAPIKRLFQLQYLNNEGNESLLTIKMATKRHASALYRAVTEKHAFYCCETVRSDVTKQFIRDLKGTIASIFNEDSSLGKKYVFDIRRTYTEVYDNARRVLFATGGAGAGLIGEGSNAAKFPLHGSEGKDPRDRNGHSLEEMLACRVCMDQTMDIAFLPCRHVLCCSECASRCTTCPLCRGELTECMKIFLPVECQQRAVQ